MYNYVYIYMYIRLIVYLSVYADICRVYDVCIYLYTCRIYICIYMFRIYYTIQCTYSKYVVHINICIYIYVHYIYQYCKHVIVPQRGYIYIPAMGWGSPEFPDQQRYKSRLFKGVNACSGW